jgi:GTP-binding protein LepA
MMASGASYNADSLGVFTPATETRQSLEAGEVGFIIAGIKELQAAKVGDTVTQIKTGSGGAAATATEALPGFKEISRRCSPGSTRPRQASTTRCATRWRKLKLNDSSLHYEPEVSQALASASAAASWACCTWRSCRSGSSASSTRT